MKFFHTENVLIVRNLTATNREDEYKSIDNGQYLEMQTALELVCKSRLSFIRLAYFYRFLSLRRFVRHCTLKC